MATARKKTTKASTTKLAPGEHTIDDVRLVKNGKSYELQWSYRPADGRRTQRHRNKGRTPADVYDRAYAKLEELQAAERSAGRVLWDPEDSMASFLESVSLPSLENNQRLAETSRRTYRTAMGLLLGRCAGSGPDHRHQHSLAEHTIASAMRYRALESLLTEIASLHSYEAARQCRIVLNKYVIGQLIREDVISASPIAGAGLDDLINARRGPRTRGGKALAASQYERCLVWLLAQDPADGVTRRQGRWTVEHLVAKRRNAIDQALLQAATGLRSTEANLIRWDQHVSIVGGQVMIHVAAEIAKGGVARSCAVLDPRVAERLIARRQRAERSGSLSDCVIGSPSNPSKPWEARNRNKAAEAVYRRMGEELGIPILRTERSHMWRTTLHTLYKDSVPEAVLDAQFGNSQQVRAKHYSDPTDLLPLMRAASQRRPS